MGENRSTGGGGPVPLPFGQPTRTGLRRDRGRLQWKPLEQWPDSQYRNQQFTAGD